MWRAFVNRGDNGGANDTNATIAKIVKLRADRAKLLGFGSHAEWRMQDTMAKSPAKAMDLMMRVWPAAKARVAEEVRDMQALATKSGAKLTIEPWDYRYYMEKVRKQRFDLSQDEIKPHFELSNMINGMFWAAGELYGLDFKENTGACRSSTPTCGRSRCATASRATSSACSTWTIMPATGSARAHGRRPIAAVRGCSATSSCWRRTTIISPSRGRASRC